MGAALEAKRRIYLAGLLPVENVMEECFAEGFDGWAKDDLGRSYWPDADTCAAKMYPDCTREQSDCLCAAPRAGAVPDDRRAVP